MVYICNQINIIVVNNIGHFVLAIVMYALHENTCVYEVQM
jgi:hypothetical protein